MGNKEWNRIALSSRFLSHLSWASWGMSMEKDSSKIFWWWKLNTKSSSTQIWWVISTGFYSGRPAPSRSVRVSQTRPTNWLIDLTACQPIKGHFTPKDEGITLIWCSYLHFYVVSWDDFFAHGPMEYEYFLCWSICPIDGTLTGTTTPGQSGHWNNSNLEPHYQMQFSVTLTIPTLLGRGES